MGKKGTKKTTKKTTKKDTKKATPETRRKARQVDRVEKGLKDGKYAKDYMTKTVYDPTTGQQVPIPKKLEWKYFKPNQKQVSSELADKWQKLQKRLSSPQNKEQKIQSQKNKLDMKHINKTQLLKNWNHLKVSKDFVGKCLDDPVFDADNEILRHDLLATHENEKLNEYGNRLLPLMGFFERRKCFGGYYTQAEFKKAVEFEAMAKYQAEKEDMEKKYINLKAGKKTRPITIYDLPEKGYPFKGFEGPGKNELGVFFTTEQDGQYAISTTRFPHPTKDGKKMQMPRRFHTWEEQKFFDRVFDLYTYEKERELKRFDWAKADQIEARKLRAQNANSADEYFGAEEGRPSRGKQDAQGRSWTRTFWNSQRLEVILAFDFLPVVYVYAEDLGWPESDIDALEWGYLRDWVLGYIADSDKGYTYTDKNDWVWWCRDPNTIYDDVGTKRKRLVYFFLDIVMWWMEMIEAVRKKMEKIKERKSLTVNQMYTAVTHAQAKKFPDYKAGTRHPLIDRVPNTSILTPEERQMARERWKFKVIEGGSNSKYYKLLHKDVEENAENARKDILVRNNESIVQVEPETPPDEAFTMIQLEKRVPREDLVSYPDERKDKKGKRKISWKNEVLELWGKFARENKLSHQDLGAFKVIYKLKKPVLSYLYRVIKEQESYQKQKRIVVGTKINRTNVIQWKKESKKAKKDSIKEQKLKRLQEIARKKRSRERNKNKRNDLASVAGQPGLEDLGENELWEALEELAEDDYPDYNVELWEAYKKQVEDEEKQALEETEAIMDEMFGSDDAMAKEILEKDKEKESKELDKQNKIERDKYEKDKKEVDKSAFASLLDSSADTPNLEDLHIAKLKADVAEKHKNRRSERPAVTKKR